MPFFKPSITQKQASDLLSRCTINPGEKPASNALELAVMTGKNWITIFSRESKAFLERLTYHQQEKKKTGTYKTSGFTHDENAGLKLNNFLCNVRAFGFYPTKDAYETSSNERCRRESFTEDHIYHNHFGNDPEYVMEYEICPDFPCEIFASSQKPSLKNLNTAAYVRFEDTLYYLHPKYKLCIPLHLDTEILKQFDRQIKPESKSRQLEDQELLQITLITRHAHLQRVLFIKKIAPHRNFDFATRASDLGQSHNLITDEKLSMIERHRRSFQKMQPRHAENALIQQGALKARL